MEKVESSFKTNKYDIIVVGDGIAALCLMHKMSLDSAFLNKKLLNIYQDDFYPSCTTRSTSIVSIGAHTRGHSPLGDTLVDSEEEFMNFLNHKPSGIYLGRQCYILDQDDHKRGRIFHRYGKNVKNEYGLEFVENQAYVIDPDELNEWFRREIKASKLLIDYKTSTVDIVLDDEHAIVCGGDMISYEQIVLATGAYTKFLFQDEHLPVGKPVSGSYLIWEDTDLFDEDISFSLKHFNITYRKKRRELIFGGSNFEGYVFEDNIFDLKQLYENFKNIMTDVKLPEFETANIRTGVRHKGRKRTPFFDHVRNDVFVINALYRNAFILAHKAGLEIASKLK